MFRLMVADFDSPSYFVAIAAVELGFFKREGIDIELERTYGAHNGANRLRDGTLHFFGGPAYSATTAFPAWKGCGDVRRTTWPLVIVMAYVLLLIVGFACGYGVRGLISRYRRASLRKRGAKSGDASYGARAFRRPLSAERRPAP
jgi:hypothetical protein